MIRHVPCLYLYVFYTMHSEEIELTHFIIFAIDSLFYRHETLLTREDTMKVSTTPVRSI